VATNRRPAARAVENARRIRLPRGAELRPKPDLGRWLRERNRDHRGQAEPLLAGFDDPCAADGAALPSAQSDDERP
jgi:hypothetical protein